MTTQPIRRVFLSYRREDSSGYVGRLFDALVGTLGRDAVFMDIDTLAPGQDFAAAIDDAINRCDAVLVVIGPGWLSLHGSSGRPRLEAPDDLFRIEVERALASGARVVPVLVGRASMPSGRELPSSIESLARRQAVEVSDRSWHADVATLVTSLRSMPVATPQAAFSSAADIASRQERKVVSILFCDLVGFTAASSATDPEDVHARLRPYHAKMQEIIQGHGGTVEKFVGDAVMAVFGAPVTHEDDAERAVRTGLRLIEAIEELNRTDVKLELRVRIGINTGEAVVAIGARPERGELLVTGDVVNIASRLQGMAPIDGVAVSEATYNRTARVFNYATLDPVQVKGRSEPLTIWQPLTPLARLGSDVLRTYTTPLIGRDIERSLIIGTFERVVKQRSCQLVVIYGEPGVGKSRLCAELFRHVEERPELVRWRQGRNLPYGDGIAFWALGEIVKAECGILESDSPEQASAKLDAVISSDEPERAWLRQRLMPLLGAGGEPAAHDELFAAWRQFFEGLAAERPTVMVFEDLHWADNAMLSFLEHLAEWSDGVPLLLVCTARPEFQERHPTWAAAVRNVQKINLEPLTHDETSALIAMLLQRTVLPAATHEALLDRAGGNPLYAEEFVQLLSDRSLLNDPLADVPFPDSLQALIAARLDTLSPARKSLLQDAAVVGKVFWSGALAAMGNLDERAVENALHELARKELVRPARTSSMHGQREYGFWHVLVRDVCYGQIPRAARASRHVAAATWIEGRAGERVDDLADVLAHHYRQALELSRVSGNEEDIPELERVSRHYLALAGDRALPIDVDSAEASFARALDLTPLGHPERAGLLERWAQAARQQVRLTEATAALEEAAAIYREQRQPVAAARALISLASVLAAAGYQQQEQSATTEALALLEARAPGPELVDAYAQLAGARVRAADFADAISAAQVALQVASELGLPEPAHALGQLGAARAYLGNTQGLEDMRRALALAIDQGRARDAAILHNNLAMVTWEYEGPLLALDLCRDGMAFCARRGIAEVALFIDAMRLTLLAASGRSDEALADAEAIAALAENANDATSLIEALSVQLTLRGELGQQVPQIAVDKLVGGARATGQPAMMTMALAAATRLATAEGQLARAKALLEELDRTNGTRDDPYYAARLPGLVRDATEIGEPSLASRLVAGIEPRTPLQRNALAASHAALDEQTGDRPRAAASYLKAASHWRDFGDIPELAYALLGWGRCLMAFDTAQGRAPLREAHELFESMGYIAALLESANLLSSGNDGAAAMDS